VKFIVFLLVVAAAWFGWQKYEEKRLEAANPAQISAPVYAEVRLNAQIESREIEQVWFVATANEAECERANSTLLGKVLAEIGPRARITTSTCKRELEPRYQRFFRNEPSHVTYFSMGRGDPAEREMRMITWGVTAEESARICEVVLRKPRTWKGPVQCVPARAS